MGEVTTAAPPSSLAPGCADQGNLQQAVRAWRLPSHHAAPSVLGTTEVRSNTWPVRVSDGRDPHLLARFGCQRQPVLVEVVSEAIEAPATWAIMTCFALVLLLGSSLVDTPLSSQLVDVRFITMSNVCQEKSPSSPHGPRRPSSPSSRARLCIPSLPNTRTTLQQQQVQPHRV